jgi:hypothetical protein
LTARVNLAGIALVQQPSNLGTHCNAGSIFVVIATDDKMESKPEVIVFIKTEKKAATMIAPAAAAKKEEKQTNAKEKIPPAAASAVKKEKQAKPQAPANKDAAPAAAVKKENETKLQAPAKEKLVSAAAVKKEKPQAPVKRQTASASNDKSNRKKKAKKQTKCCRQDACKCRVEVEMTTKVMTRKHGEEALETCDPRNGRRRNHFHTEFSRFAGTPKGNAPDCATLAARTVFPDEDQSSSMTAETVFVASLLRSSFKLCMNTQIC